MNNLPKQKGKQNKQMRKQSILQTDGALSIFSSIMSIIIGLIIGFIILLIANPSQATGGFVTILMGGFTGGAKGMGTVLYRAAPIILTGLSVGFAFKTGLFNIGASGQLIVGAFAAVYVGVNMSLPAPLHWMVAIAAAWMAGGLWALLPGILKAYYNVSEVISTIMMNYIGMYAVNYLVKSHVFDAFKNQSKTVAATAQLPKMGLDTIFAGSAINAGIFVAIIAAVVIYVILYKTTFGYELTACGFGRDAADYAGINSKKKIVMSMFIAGSLSGLAGAVLFLVSGRHIEVVDVLLAEGFNGIPVALLGLSHPIGIIFSGLFMAHLGEGGFYLQSYDYKPEVIDIIISLIIYFSAFSLLFKNFALGYFSKKEGATAATDTATADTATSDTADTTDTTDTTQTATAVSETEQSEEHEPPKDEGGAI